MRVLLVDDDPDFIELVGKMAPPSIEIVGAESSRVAISTLGNSPREAFDMAIVDLQMEPFLDNLGSREGLALAHWFRQHRRTTPLLLVSSIDEPTGRALAIESEAIGFIRKPIDLSCLYRFLESYAEMFHHTGRET